MYMWLYIFNIYYQSLQDSIIAYIDKKQAMNSSVIIYLLYIYVRL